MGTPSGQCSIRAMLRQGHHAHLPLVQVLLQHCPPPVQAAPVGRLQFPAWCVPGAQQTSRVSVQLVMLGGQFGPVPGQVSATSHGPAAGRQITNVDANLSSGHSAERLVQNSATSHGPAAGRHTVVTGKSRSSGHWAERPLQVSATSQGPADGRHTVPGNWKTLGGHAAERPVQVSATSHGPAASRHTNVSGLNWSDGH